MNSSPTSLFDSYEQDFLQFIDTIREKLEDDGGDDRSDDRKNVLRRVEMELDEADEMVSQMEIEIQGIPQSVRVQYHTRLRNAKANLSRYKKLLKEGNSQMARSDLLSSSQSFVTSDEPYGSNNDRTHLLTSTALLEDGTRRLQDSQRIALETESQGADILMNLRTQREQIENARGTLNTADSSIDRASGTLKKMIRQMYKQRIVTAAIIIVLVLLIGIIIWEKLS
ncbi:vesicle transport v-SNARE protein N-terminus-domain-containing protein [Collybia nuda]|uniref:Vesicle transport v-SNARE protein N-terminus-domain-containing protein n=1 Tax=Collybia nuda TaxID=64659 RepID=A0A9P6CQX9_9AGAR|nr:vesicle transport v-SNARE protein N-terminus-domain-containing protein [Collybia nuda]